MVNLHLPGSGEKISIIVDVGNGSVEAAILATSASGPSRILASAESLMTLEEESAAHSISTITVRMDEVLKQLAERGKNVLQHAPSSVHCFISAPWIVYKMRRTGIEYEHETLIQRQTITAIAKKILDEETEFDVQNLYEAQTMHVWLNGYPVREPVGKRAHSLALTTILSQANEVVRTKVEDALHRAFPVSPISWHSDICALCRVVAEVPTRASTYLAVEVGANSTHVISFRDGVAVDQRIVSEGTRTILKRIGGGHAPEETLALLRMLNNDAGESTANDNIRQAIATMEPELVRLFGEAIGGLAAERRIGNDLVLVAQKDMSPWLTDFFTRIDFSQFTVTTLPFGVTSADTITTDFVEDPGHVNSLLLVDAALVNINERD